MYELNGIVNIMERNRQQQQQKIGSEANHNRTKHVYNINFVVIFAIHNINRNTFAGPALFQSVKTYVSYHAPWSVGLFLLIISR